MGTHGPTDTRGRCEEASDSASSGCPRFYSIPHFENGNWFHHHAHGSAPVRSVCTCRDAPMSPHPRPSSRDTKIIPGATWQSLNVHLLFFFLGCHTAGVVAAGGTGCGWHLVMGTQERAQSWGAGGGRHQDSPPQIRHPLKASKPSTPKGLSPTLGSLPTRADPSSSPSRAAAEVFPAGERNGGGRSRPGSARSIMALSPGM